MMTFTSAMWTAAAYAIWFLISGASLAALARREVSRNRSWLAIRPQAMADVSAGNLVLSVIVLAMMWLDRATP